MRQGVRALAYLVFITFLLWCSPSIAFAYIGPGLGVAFIWTLLGPVAGILVAVVIVAYYPMRYLIKKQKRKKQEKHLEQESQSADSETDSPTS